MTLMTEFSFNPGIHVDTKGTFGSQSRYKIKMKNMFFLIYLQNSVFVFTVTYETKRNYLWLNAVFTHVLAVVQILQPKI